MFLVLIFTRGWVDPRAMVWSEGNMSVKNPVSPPGIDPGTVQLVAQRLNHYATPGPNLLVCLFIKMIKLTVLITHSYQIHTKLYWTYLHYINSKGPCKMPQQHSTVGAFQNSINVYLNIYFGETECENVTLSECGQVSWAKKLTSRFCKYRRVKGKDKVLPLQAMQAQRGLGS